MAAALASLSRGMSEELGQQALEMARRLGDSGVTAEALHMLEWFHRDDVDASQRLLDESIAISRQTGDNVRLSWVLGRSADLQMRRGRPAEAIDLLRSAAELARQRGDERTALEAELDMTDPLIELARFEQARANLDRNLANALRVREPGLNIVLIGHYAAVFAALGDGQRAGRLVGAKWAMSETLYSSFSKEEEEAWMQRVGLTRARNRLGAAAWERAVRTGRGYTLEAALDDARRLRVPDAPPGLGAQ
jgi:tetratricopeptide (TPR) repeat protein